MLWPVTTERTHAGQLTIGGVAVPDLVRRFGTPLYVFDEATLRGQARRFRTAFAAAYPYARVVYAAKAYLSPALVAILWEEGLGLDVVSGGELYAGLAAGVPASAMTFHGNNKGEDELREALAAGIGLIAVDNESELGLLARLAAECRVRVQVLLRLNPGVDVQTHAKIRTGTLDSKFGLPVATGAAAAAVARTVSEPGLALVGYHAHVGSQVYDPDAVRRTLNVIVAFAAEMRDQHGVVPRVVSPGGGFGIASADGEDEAPVEAWATAAGETLVDGCRRHGLPLPELTVEPGRAIVGPAGVALYRVGTVKEIPGVRRYVAIDGGMADNIRPALYGARYSAAVANRAEEGSLETVTIVGKYCESGDVLIEDARLPRLKSEDVLAVPAAGAYCLPMASNYNLAPRPAVVLVGSDTVRLIRRRETYADLLGADVLPERPVTVPSAPERAGAPEEVTPMR